MGAWIGRGQPVSVQGAVEHLDITRQLGLAGVIEPRLRLGAARKRGADVDDRRSGSRAQPSARARARPLPRTACGRRPPMSRRSRAPSVREHHEMRSARRHPPGRRREIATVSGAERETRTRTGRSRSGCRALIAGRDAAGVLRRLDRDRVLRRRGRDGRLLGAALRRDHQVLAHWPGLKDRRPVWRPELRVAARRAGGTRRGRGSPWSGSDSVFAAGSSAAR